MEFSARRDVFAIFFLVVIGGILANLVSIALFSWYGIDIQGDLTGLVLNQPDRIVLRLGLMINHFGSFLLPSLVFCVLNYRNRILNYLNLRKCPEFRVLVIWILILIVSYPIVALLIRWNEVIPISQWMDESQKASFALIQQVLHMEGFTELFLSFLLVGILPAIGEELLFRGVLQKTLERALNPHMAVILSSLIFGLFHLQFERILPLFFLGLLLGYSYYLSRNLWIAIILHFLNNSVQLFAMYGKDPVSLESIDEVPDVPAYLALLSLVILLWLISFVWKYKVNHDQSGS